MPNDANATWNKFFGHRTRALWERFPGCYRALVVETNDPLNMYRVRFKCPDMHDFNLKPEDCPWAVPSNDMGGFRSGRFSHPCIGDWIWIVFERQHPYAPTWIGFASPTRRKLYTYPQIFQATPLSVNEDGKPASKPNDYDINYLPRDGRPMAHGWQDRYGNLDIHSAVGFYPSEHDSLPPPPDHDAIQGSEFKQGQNKPEINNPDKKYMARITKYGHMLMLGDQGYHWKKEENSDTGEFEGKFKEDENFETKRWLYIQKLLNENKPKSSDEFGDQRRVGILTRYGHRIECRDVGWAQLGPIQSKSRQGEYGSPRILSKETENDFRWIKIRTKGGMLFQAYDKGFHPDNDAFIKRSLLQEQGHMSENEHKHWKNKDARWIRIVTRHGLKFVLDDRGTDDKDSHGKETPRPNGILIKGRRTPAAKNRDAHGDPRGFYWEFNENDAANHTTWGTPLGQVVEMNDRYQYTMMATSMGKGWSPKWRNLKENEFIRKPTMLRNPERTSHHLKLDHDNEYLRLKTRANKGPSPENPINQSGVGSSELNQGIEARDGANDDGPWVEVVDCQHRGMWWSKRYQIGVWRAKKKREMYMWMDENKREIVIYNNNGKIMIYSSNDIELVSGRNIHMQAAGKITMRAGGNIPMQAGSTKMTIGNSIMTNTDIKAESVRAFIHGALPGPGAGRSHSSGEQVGFLQPPAVPAKIEPSDRAKTYNGPFQECPQNEVEHKI